MVDKNCISTINHRRFNPATPSPQDIEINDIAHALSLITRANGHFSQFYSVARHSINCAYEAEKRGYSNRVCLACLLHDAAEAYIGDMTRPLKMHIPYFSQLEKDYQRIIFAKYAFTDISDTEKALVCAVDDSLLYHEFLKYNGEALFDEAPEINIELENFFNGFEETEKEFLNLYARLSGR